MNNLSRWRSVILSAAFLTFLAFSVRAYCLLHTDSWPDSESAGRALMAQEWALNPRLIPDLNFGPFYYYIVGGMLRLWHDPVLVPRLVSFAFGALTVIPFYSLINLIFGGWVAFFSGILFCFYPLHIQYSVFSTADSLFIFFLVCAIYFCFKLIYCKNKCLLNLIACLLFLNLAAGLRFEGWVFIAVLWGILLNKKPESAAVFLSGSLLFPVAWMAACYFYTGNPLIFHSTSLHESRIYLLSVPFYQRIGYWPYILGKTLSPWLLAFSGAGIFSAFARKQKLELAVIFIFVLGVYIFRTAAGGFETLPRYSIVLGLLIIPYCLFALGLIRARITRAAWYALMAAVVSLSLVYFARTIKSDIAWMTMPQEEKSLAGWLELNTGRGDNVMLDINLDITEALRLYSRLPLSAVHVPRRNIEMRGKVIDKMESGDFFLKKRPRYVVIAAMEPVSGRFSGLSMDELTAERYGCRFNRVYKSRNYAVFESLCPMGKTNGYNKG